MSIIRHTQFGNATGCDMTGLDVTVKDLDVIRIAEGKFTRHSIVYELDAMDVKVTFPSLDGERSQFSISVVVWQDKASISLRTGPAHRNLPRCQGTEVFKLAWGVVEPGQSSLLAGDIHTLRLV